MNIINKLIGKKKQDNEIRVYILKENFTTDLVILDKDNYKDGVFYYNDKKYHLDFQKIFYDHEGNRAFYLYELSAYPYPETPLYDARTFTNIITNIQQNYDYYELEKQAILNERLFIYAFIFIIIAFIIYSFLKDSGGLSNVLSSIKSSVGLG